MPYREYMLDVFDGYESPPNDETHQFNCMFDLHGYSDQINLAFYTRRRGTGNTINEALQNAYRNLANKMNIKHHVTITEMYVENTYELELDNKDNGHGFIFYPLTEVIRQEFRDHETNL